MVKLREKDRDYWSSCFRPQNNTTPVRRPGTQPKPLALQGGRETSNPRLDKNTHVNSLAHPRVMKMPRLASSPTTESNRVSKAAATRAKDPPRPQHPPQRLPDRQHSQDLPSRPNPRIPQDKSLDTIILEHAWLLICALSPRTRGTKPLDQPQQNACSLPPQPKKKNGGKPADRLDPPTNHPNPTRYLRFQDDPPDEPGGGILWDTPTRFFFTFGA